MSSEYLLPDEVAAKLRQHRGSVLRRMRKGTLPGVKVGSRWLCPADELDAFIEQSKRPAADVA